MPFRTGFLPVVLVSAALGLKLHRMALVDPPMGPLIASYLQSCTYAPGHPLHGFICVVEPLFRELVTNEIGKAFLTAFGTSGMVMSIHLHLKAGQAGGSRVFSTPLLVAHTLAGQVFGAGIVGPIFLPLFLALSQSLEPPTRKPVTPASYAYTVTLLGIQFLVFLLSTALTALPPTSQNWVYANYAFQAFPLLFLPLAFFPDPKNVSPPSTLGMSTFKVLKYMYAPLHYLTLFQGIAAYRAGEPFTAACRFMALDFVGFIATFLGMSAIDALAAADVNDRNTGNAHAQMGFLELLARLLLAGPASAMAAYYERKEATAVARAGKEKAT
ncbi:hypothetical protein C8R44DRAFT_805955 [Mycena epipterygia]|nr:hypothetical protein C8R44DRAFT_805955 [Mycena epipterygia]